MGWAAHCFRTQHFKLLNSDLKLHYCKQVDGIYDSDPLKNAEAKKYTSRLSYRECVIKNLDFMDGRCLFHS